MIDVFRIGVSLAFTSDGPQVLGVLLRDLLKIHNATNALTSNFAKLKYGAVGALAVVGGGEALKGMWEIVKGSEELNRQLMLTKTLNPQFASDIGTIRSDAYRYSAQVGTALPEDFVKMQREVFTQMPSLMDDKAARDKMLPQLGELAWQLQQGNGGNQEKAVFDAIKGIDIRGQIFSKGADGKEHVDPQKAMAELNAMMQGIRASGYTLTPSDYKQMIAQSGIISKNMDARTLYGYLTEAAMTLGASKTGTALGSLYQQMQGGTVPLHVTREWEKQGFIKEGRDFKIEKGGHVTMTASGRKNMDMKDFSTHLDKWINDFFIGGEKKRGLNDKQILEEISRMFGRQTTQRLVAEMVQNAPQFARTATMFDSAYTADKAASVMNNESLGTNQKKLSVAWGSFVDSMGEAGTPAAIAVLHDLTNGIHQITEVVLAHPDAARRFMETTAGLAGLVTAGGSLTLFTVAMSPFTKALSLLGKGSAAATALTTLGSVGGAGSLAAFGIGITAVATAVGSWVFAYQRINAALADMVSPEEKARLLDSVSPAKDVQTHIRLALQNKDRRDKDRGWIAAPGGGSAPRLSPHDANSSVNPANGSHAGNAATAPVTLQNTTIVNLDSQPIYKKVTTKMARGLTSAFGPTGGDPRAGATPAGAVGQQ